MQSTASRRTFSALASKIHPQLPLSPRESQQLLNLLTTSFRAHLDREHPVPLPEDTRLDRKPAAPKLRTNAPPIRVDSSYSSAAHHLDSILRNPLLATRPQRRGSEPAAVDVLKDPLGWFLDQIATGAANIPKADMCLEVLQRMESGAEPGSLAKAEDERKPGAVIAAWLRSSGLDTSKEFLDPPALPNGPRRRLINRLVPQLLSEGEQAPLWHWFTRSPEQLAQKADLDAPRIQAFRTQVLVQMVSSSQTCSRDEALAIFLRAFDMMQAGEGGLTKKILQPAGACLVNHIVAQPQMWSTPALYESFLRSSQDWLGAWSRVVQSMLYLYHPTKPTAHPGFSLIQSPGALLYAASSTSRRQFLVRLCLGVAHELLAEEKFDQAQIAMDFTRDHFADIVLSRVPIDDRQAATRARAQKEKENLEMLDRLLPT